MLTLYVSACIEKEVKHPSSLFILIFLIHYQKMLVFRTKKLKEINLE